jgi:hypothetical protein
MWCYRAMAGATSSARRRMVSWSVPSSFTVELTRAMHTSIASTTLVGSCITLIGSPVFVYDVVIEVRCASRVMGRGNSKTRSTTTCEATRDGLG